MGFGGCVNVAECGCYVAMDIVEDWNVLTQILFSGMQIDEGVILWYVLLRSRISDKANKNLFNH